MEKNSIIVEIILKELIDKFTMTESYKKSCDKLSEVERQFTAEIINDEELFQKYLDVESFTNKNHIEYESVCFCEGLRLGFKLCMDIFNIW